MLLLSVCKWLVLEVQGFCWSVCIVLLVCSCISSEVLSVSSSLFRASILLLMLVKVACSFSVALPLVICVVCVSLLVLVLVVRSW